MNAIDHIEAVLTGRPPEKTLAWLRESFARHIETGETLGSALGIVDAAPRGLRDGLLRRRWKAKLHQAIDALDSPGVSHRSIAVILANEFARQSRSRRPPKNRLEELVAECRRTYDAPVTSIDALWHEVRKYRESNP